MAGLEDSQIALVRGPASGRHAVVIVGMHGNERLGPAIWDWLQGLKLDRGQLSLILANPTAVDRNVRYVNVNLNRRIGLGLDEYPEDKLARQIEAVLDQADASLDIHQYNDKMDRPFVITGPKGLDIAMKMPAEYVATGWTDFGDGATDDYMENNGRVGLCFECGAVGNVDDYLPLAKQGVLTFLHAVGLIDAPGEHSATPPVRLQIVDIVTKQSDDFAFDRVYTTFDDLEPGQVFASQAGRDYTAGANQYIIFPRPNAVIGDEAFTLAESTAR